MNTKIIRVEENDIDEALIREAGDVIKAGGLVAFPTETVYGLGGDALNPESSKKIYAAKGRPSDNPLIVHIADLGALSKIVKYIPKEAYVLAEVFWPGPLTMIFEKSDAVPFETTGGLSTVAVRMPSDKIANAFIKAAGGYVAAPSANLSGKPSPTEDKYVIEDMDGRIDMILCGGRSLVGLESTIVDLTEETPVILRPGYITEDMLSKALGIKVLWDRAIKEPAADVAPKAPGMKYRHYAPNAPLTIVEGDADKVADAINRLGAKDIIEGKKVAVIAAAENTAKYDKRFLIKSAGSFYNEDEAARLLFAILRELDDEDAQVIYSEAFKETGVGCATMNRLMKAAGHHVLKV
ncbi:MAG: threonylcarbamoyl-AMP synthase [Lachnospiraceae bacterium]|nr:threonylcarbamoyl-AMP synthase [Lachnospiraceae bacterium]